jgi:hypothetical protein
MSPQSEPTTPPQAGLTVAVPELTAAGHAPDVVEQAFGLDRAALIGGLIQGV